MKLRTNEAQSLARMLKVYVIANHFNDYTWHDVAEDKLVSFVQTCEGVDIAGLNCADVLQLGIEKTFDSHPQVPAWAQICAGLTRPQAEKILSKLCSLEGLPIPTL